MHHPGRGLSEGCFRQIELSNLFRSLWGQHIMWTRSFIISTMEGLEDLEFVTERLLQNPKDFAQQLQHFYGRQQAGKFGRLLEQHLRIGAALVQAVKAGNAQQREDSRREWYRNADEMAQLLVSLNPSWRLQEWQQLFYDHLGMVEEEAVLRQKKDYHQSVEMYDAMEEQALIMADYMYVGIREQFGV